MSLKNNDLNELIISLSVMLLAILVFSFVLFGIAGIRVVLAIIFISVPFYLILHNFGLSEGEKFVFSALLGPTLFSSLTYLLGLVMSFRIAIAAAFIILICIAVALTKYRNFEKAGN